MIKDITKHRAIAAMSLMSILFAVGGFAWAILAISNSSAGPFILHFNDMTLITSVGGLSAIIFMGVVGLVATVINFFISLALAARDAFLGKIVAGGTLIFAILLFIAFAAILNVN